MATNSEHSRHNPSCVSNVSLSENERERLNQRMLMLTQELSSLNVILERSKVTQSVPNPCVNREEITRANTSIGSNEPPFHGFSYVSPYFRRTDAGIGTDVRPPTPPNEQLRQRENRVTQTEQMSNRDVTPQQTMNQHHDVNVIITEHPTPSLNRLMGLRSIDEWVEDACNYNSIQSSTSVSTTLHELPSLHQGRDNIRGSTKVELLNSSTIAPRYGEQGIDRVDRHGFGTRHFSMEADVFDTRSSASQHPSQWGSTKVELLNASRHSGGQRLVQNHHMDQRQQGIVDQHEHLDTQFRRNCGNVSYHQPRLHYGRGSTNVELLNTSPYYEGCGDEYGHAVNQMDPRQVLRELPDQGERRNLNFGNVPNQFPYKSAPITQDIGQSYDHQGNSRSYHPFEDQQKNFPDINRTLKSENRESHDRQSQHDGVIYNREKDFAQSNNLPNQTHRVRVGTDNDVMQTFVSRQTLGKDLPEYNGEISKWISFIDHYNDTTDNCKFTDRENIRRLRKCLKGKAYTCVESLLVSSTDPKIIISMLQRRFGRPEDIVKAEIQKVKAIPSPKEDDPQSIIEYATAVQNLVTTLETLKKSDHLRNPVLLDELQDKLPPTLNLMWSEYIVDRKEDLTLRVLANWLDRRAEAASRRTTFKVHDTEPTQKQKHKARINTVKTSIGSDTTIANSCYSCYGTCKSLEECESFAKLDVHKRWDIAKKNKLCFFCLSTSHEFKDCTKKVECKIKGCKRFHHKLLHTTPKKVGIIKANASPHITKLRIVPVFLYGKSTEIKTFALLDPGSTSTLMSEHLSNLLKLDGPNSPLLLEWMNGDVAVENDSKIVDTRIQGTQDGAKIYDLFNVRTVKNLPLHKQTIDKSALVKQWPYLRKIDFDGYENAQPQLLIGENNGLLIATRQLVHDTWNTPIASKTWLGWVISGNEGKSPDTAAVKIFTAHEIETDSLHELVKSSFILDEAGVSNQKLSRSKEDERALGLLEKYSTINDNRWETGLLWRDEQAILPESRKNALLRLFILEKKLDKNPVLRQRYNEIIDEYLDKQFIRKCEKSDPTFPRSWYLPHFPVLYPLKPGKVRIVFDAAAKSNGMSLNDYLLPGPDLLKSLISVLFKFRQDKIGFLGDIKDMFHRIKMRPADASCQKILWRGNSRSSEPEEYELNVMSFGANCSPCSAIYIKDKNARWMWVPTDSNPADDATRSNKVPDFSQNSRWYQGPDFLYEHEANWPKQPSKQMALTNESIEVLEFNNFIIEKPNFQLPDATRFSKWLRLLRATSWILRFVNNCKRTARIDGFELTVDETRRAEILLVKDHQRRCFSNEIALLKKGKPIDVNSRLYSLCPRLDENGIMRLYGRTDRLPDSLRSLKEPIILDGKDYCVKLIIRFFHEKANHFGHEMVLNELRQLYWIVGAKVALRAVRNECNKCKLLLAQPSRIIMGQLPLARITGGNPPFTFCGVDYFGPILVKQGRSTVKRYGVLFTCLTVRAVHIEIAHSLTTDSCIMAIRRFTANHICPKEMYSDNGTNLRGSDTELQANLKELDQDKIRGWMTTHRIKWFFNPPTAAHMGGSWERLVRSIKTALYATLNTIHPSDEVLATLLAEAQHVTNSRPLLEISDHPDEEETLTPNHFLIGRSSASAPIGEFNTDDLILKKQWRASQHLADLFWQRWLKEFLPTLTKRTKWFLSTRRPKIGDLVLIADPDEKRGNWPRGIITAVFPGIDNEIRVVDVTTQSGTYRRPMHKICLLESTVTPVASVLGENV